jgi:hypothetical protein
MIGRRPFLIASGGVVAAPVLAHLAQPATGTSVPQSVAADLSAATASLALADPQGFALRVDGWDAPDDPNPTAHGEVWIHINSSWRAAWR